MKEIVAAKETEKEVAKTTTEACTVTDGSELTVMGDDKYLFCVIQQNVESSRSIRLYCDAENYLVCHVPGLPTWIWTKDKFDWEVLRDIEQIMTNIVAEGDVRFVCKKELYALLAADDYEWLTEDCFEMGGYVCKKSKQVKEVEGGMVLPSPEDDETLGRYWYESCQEMQGVEPISLQEATAEMMNLRENKSLAVWKDASGKIVCMGRLLEFAGMAKINHVFTPKEERSKGYAANLVKALTDKTLRNGKVPVIYTDYRYPASNKAYQNVGYCFAGLLINFSCSKN